MKSISLLQRESGHLSTRQRFVRDRFTWASYWMLGYFAFLQTILGPLMPFIRGDLRLSYVLASLHFSAFAFGAAATGTVGDRITRRWGRRAAFWGGGIGMAAGAALLALGTTAVETIAGALLMGLLGSLLLINLQAALADRHGPRSVVALTEANVWASGFALLASVAVGVVTGAGLSWRLALPPAIVLLALVGLRYRSMPIPEPSPHGRVKERTRAAGGPLPPRYWGLWCVLALETAVEWCVAYWGASFLATQARFSKADAATSLGAFFVAMLIGRYAGSRLSRAFSGMGILAAALGVALLGLPLFWLAPLPLLRVVGLFVTGLGLANVYPVGVALAASVVPSQSGRATARLAMGSGLAVLIAPVILGALADTLGIGRAFGIALPMLLVALLALCLVARPRDTASV